MNTNTDKNGPGASSNARLPRESQLKMSQYRFKLQEIKRLYWVHMTAARIIFKNDFSTMRSLGLHETSWDVLFPWTRQAREFYQKVLHNEEILGKMMDYGITREELELGLLKLKDLEGNKYWKKQCNEEEAAGEYRLQESLAKLEEYMEDFKWVSRQAFKDQPQYLVTLGIEKSLEDAIESVKRDERRQWKTKSEPPRVRPWEKEKVDK
ncbi:MAG: hypothetical protein QG657_2537 [Acidobacteriota bacterium]|nr:hypothetical protein [Acidobacteriota bacterium]